MGKPVQLDANDIKAIASVIEALEALPDTIKIRGVRFDVRHRYNRHITEARVRLTGARSTWSKSIHVSAVERP